jgi:hypothetical protein
MTARAVFMRKETHSHLILEVDSKVFAVFANQHIGAFGGLLQF